MGNPLGKQGYGPRITTDTIDPEDDLWVKVEGNCKSLDDAMQGVEVRDDANFEEVDSEILNEAMNRISVLTSALLDR